MRLRRRPRELLKTVYADLVGDTKKHCYRDGGAVASISRLLPSWLKRDCVLLCTIPQRVARGNSSSSRQYPPNKKALL